MMQQTEELTSESLQRGLPMRSERLEALGDREYQSPEGMDQEGGAPREMS